MSRCFLLLIDGLRPDVAHARLAAGELPNISAMLETGGRSIAITGFPSTTSVAYLPFLTGAAPGRCNIPSIRWLDRSAYQGHWWRDRSAVRSYCGYQAPLLDADLSPYVKTMFELVPDSIGIFTPVARGLSGRRDPARLERKLWGSVAHVTKWHQPSDDSVARHLLRAADADWRFVFAQFPAVDGYSHQSGPDSAPVHRALRRVDATVGALRQRLEQRGELDQSLILLVSDHGSSSVHNHLDLADWFRARGVPTLSHPVVWSKAPRAAVMVAGNGSAMIYARPEEPRESRWPVEQLRRVESFESGEDLVEALLRERAVGLLAAESEQGGLWIGGKAGDALLVSHRDQIIYQPLSGDPLMMGDRWSGTSREWLERTWDGPFPDAAFHLMDQFRSPRSGDLLVIAREGYDFRGRFEVPKHRAGHGSLIRAHMQTPVWSSRPMPEPPIRTVDLFPSMLDWLGVAPPSVMDGELVWSPRGKKRHHDTPQVIASGR
jgi:Type I phosphodiesterase / nucleotide pyrophosphatase